MNDHANITITGIPDNIDAAISAVFRSRAIKAFNDLRNESNVDELDIRIANISSSSQPDAVSTNNDVGEHSNIDRAKQYTTTYPLWSLNQLIVPTAIKDELLTAIETIQLETLVFDDWGLRIIEPFPRSALNFHGPPGTGKTLAAHGIASEIGKKILVASYAQIESKYHGDGPKNVEALFYAADKNDAVLFIDEADSLLSKRLTNVQQGSEQAINSMRSQLLICLEKYKGIVIFATNLVENYDSAFETRVRHIHFPKPDLIARREIWRKHLIPTLPLSEDVNIDLLAGEESDFCGRDIKNAVIDAALQVARCRRNIIMQQDIVSAINKIVSSRSALKTSNYNSTQLTDAETAEINTKLKTALHSSCITESLSV